MIGRKKKGGGVTRSTGGEPFIRFYDELLLAHDRL